jgi:hypothetical protein
MAEGLPHRFGYRHVRACIRVSRGALRPGYAASISPEGGRSDLKRGAGDPRVRAPGMPGARCTRSLVCKMKNTRVSHHRFTGTPGIPCAMVLTVSFELSLVTGLSCHHHPCDAQRHYFGAMRSIVIGNAQASSRA